MSSERRGLDGVRALVFDVFGTLVDWRSGVARELASLASERAIDLDAFAFADAWRAAYRPSMERVARGEREWAILDTLHRESFETLWAERRLPTLDERDVARAVDAWHRLDPWPDVRAGLARLRERYLLATLSNGNLRLLIDLARFGDLRFDTIFSSETFAAYKPDPRTYLGAARQFGCAPHEVALVAAHDDDLRAAAACGLHTVFVRRPFEYSATAIAREPEFAADLVVDALGDIIP